MTTNRAWRSSSSYASPFHHLDADDRGDVSSLSYSPPAQSALLEMVERDAIRILPIESGDLPAIRGLMRKYADLPMDFADATLVHVANRTNVRTVFTLERRDFSVYRFGRRRSFTILPN